MTFRQRTDGLSDTVLDLEVAPGGGLGLHYHDAFSETFTCLSGVLGVQVGPRVLRLRPGESATVPTGTAHRWFNDSDEVATARVTIAPGHAGMERALIFLYGLARDGQLRRGGVPSSILHLALITDLSNTRGTGVLGLVTPCSPASPPVPAAWAWSATCWPATAAEPGWPGGSGERLRI